MTRNEGSLITRITGAGTATAVAAALLLGSAPGALADDQAAGSLKGIPTPAIYPTPQSVAKQGEEVPLSGKVTLVVGADTDPATVKAAKDVLGRVSHNLDVVSDGQKVHGGSVIYLGTPADNPAVGTALGSLGIDAAPTLGHSEGYVLATGKIGGQNTAVLAGADKSGSYYAVQTLRQVISGKKIAPVRVLDWPLMSVRGTVEGFYGTPWSHQARLDQFAFYGEQKMNTYIYSPKDDPLLRAQWRSLYTGAEQQQLKELIDTATANHVKFTYALSPGNDICYSTTADLDSTVAKFESLYTLGVRDFYIALDDIAPYLQCAADKAMFPKTNFRGLADAQAYYLNAVNAAFIKKHPDVGALQMVPTNYAGSAADPYKGELGIMMDKDILLQWTGEQVVSHRITTASTKAAQVTYGTAANPRGLFIWDNYPVNDFAQNRLFLAPLIGRDKDLYTATTGITSNPMIESYASLPTLFNFADFTWNGPAYQPRQSMAAALKLVAGPGKGALESLTAFADLNQNWQDDALTPNAPALSADVAAFWAAYDAGTFPTRSALADRAELIRHLPKDLATIASAGFYADARHWIDAAANWGDATASALDMLRAVKDDNGAAVVVARLRLNAAVTAAGAATQPTHDQGLLVPKVGDGVFQSFIAKAKSLADAWLGAVPVAGSAPKAVTSFAPYGNNTADKMFDGDTGTIFWTNSTPSVGSTIGADYGAPISISKVLIQQSDSDTTLADMMYHATLQYSVDGTTWTDAGTFDNAPVISATFATPVTARYVRIKASAVNPAGQWVKIREFTVSTVPAGVSSTIAAAAGTTLADAVDGRVDTAWQGARPAVGGDNVTQVFDARVLPSVTVIGAVTGTVQVQRAGVWVNAGTLLSGYTKVTVGGAPVSGVRLVLDGGPAPVINEIILAPQ
ncbi:beta-N-acetylglucosaminidase domain-containing protein [Specibacter cremeus]|uniref:beta-N-acetylglucosaminidase domain-containing protein n=1 Tax=Specibacter cremeus TaxID=1629051 RepID=UPI000F774083|nr:beta-N-acetylglucosaminidase domain-containing protein [Specibacter cremeus]